jgi:hypothetical protein
VHQPTTVGIKHLGAQISGRGQQYNCKMHPTSPVGIYGSMGKGKNLHLKSTVRILGEAGPKGQLTGSSTEVVA